MIMPREQNANRTEREQNIIILGMKVKKSIEHEIYNDQFNQSFYSIKLRTKHRMFLLIFAYY